MSLNQFSYANTCIFWCTVYVLASTLFLSYCSWSLEISDLWRNSTVQEHGKPKRSWTWVASRHVFTMLSRSSSHCKSHNNINKSLDKNLLLQYDLVQLLYEPFCIWIYIMMLTSGICSRYVEEKASSYLISTSTKAQQSTCWKWYQRFHQTIFFQAFTSCKKLDFSAFEQAYSFRKRQSPSSSGWIVLTPSQ